jgi:hypothetical protein
MLDAGSPSHPMRSWRLPKGRRPRGREGFVARAARGCQMVRVSAPDGGPSRAAAGAQSELEAGRGLPARARAAPQALSPSAPHHRVRRPREADRAKGVPLAAHRERGEEGQTSWSSLRRRASRARRAGRRLARWTPKRCGGAFLSRIRRPPHAGKGRSRGHRRTHAFGEGRCDAPSSRLKPRAPDLLPTRRGCASTLRQLLGGLEVA